MSSQGTLSDSEDVRDIVAENVRAIKDQILSSNRWAALYNEARGELDMLYRESQNKPNQENICSSCSNSRFNSKNGPLGHSKVKMTSKEVQVNVPEERGGSVSQTSSITESVVDDLRKQLELREKELIVERARASQLSKELADQISKIHPPVTPKESISSEEVTALRRELQASKRKATESQQSRDMLSTENTELLNEIKKLKHNGQSAHTTITQLRNQLSECRASLVEEQSKKSVKVAQDHDDLNSKLSFIHAGLTEIKTSCAGKLDALNLRIVQPLQSIQDACKKTAALDAKLKNADHARQRENTAVITAHLNKATQELIHANSDWQSKVDKLASALTLKEENNVQLISLLNESQKENQKMRAELVLVKTQMSEIKQGMSQISAETFKQSMVQLSAETVKQSISQISAETIKQITAQISAESIKQNRLQPTKRRLEEISSNELPPQPSVRPRKTVVDAEPKVTRKGPRILASERKTEKRPVISKSVGVVETVSSKSIGVAQTTTRKISEIGATAPNSIDAVQTTTRKISEIAATAPNIINAVQTTTPNSIEVVQYIIPKRTGVEVVTPRCTDEEEEEDDAGLPPQVEHSVSCVADLIRFARVDLTYVLSVLASHTRMIEQNLDSFFKTLRANMSTLSIELPKETNPKFIHMSSPKLQFSMHIHSAFPRVDIPLAALVNESARLVPKLVKLLLDRARSSIPLFRVALVCSTVPTSALRVFLCDALICRAPNVGEMIHNVLVLRPSVLPPSNSTDLVTQCAYFAILHTVRQLKEVPRAVQEWLKDAPPATGPPLQHVLRTIEQSESVDVVGAVKCIQLCNVVVPGQLLSSVLQIIPKCRPEVSASLVQGMDALLQRIGRWQPIPSDIPYLSNMVGMKHPFVTSLLSHISDGKMLGAIAYSAPLQPSH